MRGHLLDAGLNYGRRIRSREAPLGLTRPA
jgi:hypothetical protein